MWARAQDTLACAPMKTPRKTITLALATLLALMVLAVGPAVAAEEQPAGEESGKVSLPSNPRDQLGLIILGVTAMAALLALGNAAKQLRGERPQASGRIRWR